MTPRLVRFTATAQSHVEREKRWWLENRAHTEIFADELDVAVKLLALLPGVGCDCQFEGGLIETG